MCRTVQLPKQQSEGSTYCVTECMRIILPYQHGLFLQTPLASFKTRKLRKRSSSGQQTVGERQSSSGIQTDEELVGGHGSANLTSRHAILGVKQSASCLIQCAHQLSCLHEVCAVEAGAGLVALSILISQPASAVDQVLHYHSLTPAAGLAL